MALKITLKDVLFSKGGKSFSIAIEKIYICVCVYVCVYFFIKFQLNIWRLTHCSLEDIALILCV